MNPSFLNIQLSKFVVMMSFASLFFAGLSTAATTLNPGGSINTSTDWTNGNPTTGNPGTIAVDGTLTTSVVSYGGDATITQSAGNIVASGTNGFNFIGSTDVYHMTGGTFTARYLNANGSTMNLSGGSFILSGASGTNAVQLNSSGTINISRSFVMDATTATASPTTGSGTAYNFDSNLVGRDAVRQGILNVDEDSGHALSVTNTKAVPTSHAEYPMRSDYIHFNWVSIFKMGRHMAYEMLELEEISYASWAATHSLTGGEDDDDDHDGLSNFFEFALGADPNNGSDAPRPTTGEINIDGAIYPTYVLQRNLDASNTTVDVMYSADLEDWSTLSPVFLSRVYQPDGTSILTYRSPLSLDDPNPPRIFFRSEVD